jgi:hypothetical protein
MRLVYLAVVVVIGILLIAAVDQDGPGASWLLAGVGRGLVTVGSVFLLITAVQWWRERPERS